MEQNDTYLDNMGDEVELVRLQKYFTDCGVLSRRAAEAEIAAGHVKVNGIVATIGQKIDPARDEVTLSGKPVKAPKRTERTTVLLHKPAGFVTTTSDEQGRPCVTDLLADLPVRLYPIGRLDINSTGLLLLTDDGELANLLTHPRHHVPKVYHVTVGGEITDEELRKLSSPMVIDGYRIRPVKVTCLQAYEHKSVLEMTLREGRNRQIRKMCATLDLHILSLTRVAMGPLVLGHLPEGKFRYLSPSEVEALRQAALHAGEKEAHVAVTENETPKAAPRSKKGWAKAAVKPSKPRHRTTTPPTKGVKKPTGRPRTAATKEK